MTGRALVIAASVLVALSSCAHRPLSDSTAVTHAWCTALVRDDEAAAERLMTQSLRAEVARMRAVDRDFRRDHPGDKPPLGDGLRLTSFPDAIASCATLRVDGDTSLVQVTPAGSPDGAWEDRLRLRTEAGISRVDDVEFGPTGSDRLRVWLAAGGM